MGDLLHDKNNNVTPEAVERVARRAHVLRYGEVSVPASGYATTVFSLSEEELASARAALFAVSRSGDENKETTEECVERIAVLVHDAWLSRNRSRADSEELRPYAELSEETKEKDRVYARATIEALFG